MRKCIVLANLDNKKECDKTILVLEEVAFQSERSQIIYNEIKNIRERLVNPNFKRGRKQPNLQNKNQEDNTPQTPANDQDMTSTSQQKKQKYSKE